MKPGRPLGKTKKVKKLILRISPEVKNQFKAWCAMRNTTMSLVIEKKIKELITAEINVNQLPRTL